MWNWFKKHTGKIAIVSSILTGIGVVCLLLFPPTMPVCVGVAIIGGISFFAGGIYCGNAQLGRDQAEQGHTITEINAANDIATMKAAKVAKQKGMVSLSENTEKTANSEIYDARVNALIEENKISKTKIDLLIKDRDADRLANARTTQQMQQQIDGLEARVGKPNPLSSSSLPVIPATSPGATNSSGSSIPSGTSISSSSTSSGAQTLVEDHPRTTGKKPTRNQGNPSDQGMFAPQPAANEPRLPPKNIRNLS